MEFLILILCVIPLTVTPITIHSNGNSPEIKMIGGMMVDTDKGFASTTVKVEESTAKNLIERSKKLSVNSTKLALNERYRRLIPYMTFYYANDLVTPVGEPYPRVKEIEVEKAQIVDAKELEPSSQRLPKKIIYPINRSIPRYQGNRLTHYNIASANPTKLFYKDYTPIPTHQSLNKFVPNYNPFLLDSKVLLNNNYNSGRLVQRPIVKAQSVPFSPPPRKQHVNFFQNDDTPNTRYYLSEKEQAPKYKLVPYEQTPPVKVAPQNENFYEIKKPIAVPVLVPQEVYIKPRPGRPHYYETDNVQVTKRPTVVSEDYFEHQRPPRPHHLPSQLVIESGFMPITDFPTNPTEAPVYTSTVSQKYIPEDESQHVVEIETENKAPLKSHNTNFYEYVEQPTFKPPQYSYNGINIAALLNTLQRNKSIPKPITRANVGSSIKTLLQVLNALKAVQENDEIPILSTPKPFVAPKIVLGKPIVKVTPKPSDDELDAEEEPYLAPVEIPSQHLDDLSNDDGNSQRFPLPVLSDDEGGTPGKPGADYPILTTIPHTSFDCKSQRYKGFFADTETRCQVWHYCDLNGGQASFLCPNGTIFSQAGLTCDWWFNVKCSNTPQLYVLNESLYKFILPHSPKFPEDFSGPLVDKYLTLKFKEMEEEFKKNKSKKTAKDKMDSGEGEDSKEQEEESEEISRDKDDGSGPSVIVESPGTSGNVERLTDNL